MERYKLDSRLTVRSKGKMIIRNAAVGNPRDEHSAVDLLRERAAAGQFKQPTLLSLDPLDTPPSDTPFFWAGQHIQPHAHHQLEPTTRPVDSSASHIPQGSAARAGGHEVRATPVGGLGHNVPALALQMGPNQAGTLTVIGSTAPGSNPSCSPTSHRLPGSCFAGSPTLVKPRPRAAGRRPRRAFLGTV